MCWAAWARGSSFLHIEQVNGELIGNLQVQSSRIKGGVIEGAMTAAVIDEIPVLAVLGAVSEEGLIVRDAAELRVKETDRIETIARNLQRMGIVVTTTPDGLEIHGTPDSFTPPKSIPAAITVSQWLFPSRPWPPIRPVSIQDAEAASVSFPEFYTTLRAAGSIMATEDLVETDLSYEDLVHDLNNVFETITEAAELLNSDRRWKSLSATLRRSVNRGKRLVGAFPDTTPNLAAIVEDAIQSVTDYSTAARKPHMRFVRQIPPEVRLPGSAKDWERVFANLFLNAGADHAQTRSYRHCCRAQAGRSFHHHLR